MVLMWRPRITLFLRVDQSGATISWDALKHQTHREGHPAGKVSDFKAFECVGGGVACVIHHCKVGQPVGGATEGKQ